ncbi:MULTISPECIES: TorF family putative porin [unclassified Sphingosinithalassobacter]|uniref:TorF family putative porin n=1 Tax=unclassified Sphingosinithalassobacter TaxID=2676235 RepID=UPI00165D4286|nr:TorF family putative porin [Sphingosinithalassobacter sp. CS137]
MRYSHLTFAALMLAGATPAFAQDVTDPAPPITISGGAAVVSDYRFRGFSQSNEEAAIQGSIGIEHESGFYLGTWGSSIGFANGTEIDFFGGYATEVAPGIGFDIGATYYAYPGGGADVDIIEPYVALTGELGPVSTKLGLAYAPAQESLGDESSVYIYTDLGTALPGTPIALSAHLGYAESDSFLGGPDGDVFDYSIGASVTYSALTLGVAYVNTDVDESLGKEALGADGGVVFSLSASF